MNAKYLAARASDQALAYQRFVAASERETNLS
jgi:hypothetical protein